MTALLKYLAAACALFSLSGCGKEIGRVPFSSEGTKSTVLELSSGSVAFWTDLDISYDGVAALEYRIDLSQAGRRVATAVCDPFGPMDLQLGWITKARGNSHSASGRGRMTCGVTLPKGGPTTVGAALVFRDKPAVLALRQADLVVKQ